MNSSSKIILDRLIAKPIAFLLNLIAWPLGKIISYDHSDSPEKVNTIAIAKLLGMGSILRATPMIRALKTKYPKARYLFITTLKNKALLERLELFDIHLYIGDSSFLNIFFDVLFLLPRLWHYKIDLYFDLEVYSAFSTVITTLSLSRNRYGFYIANTNFRRELHTHLVYFNDYRQISSIYFQFARACGIDKGDFGIEKPVLKDELKVEFLKAMQKNKFPETIPYIIINPNASDLLLERRWPMEYFVLLIDALVIDWPNPIFILGSPDERNYSRACWGKLSDKAKKNVVNLSGEVSFGAAMVFINKARLMITNDSGLYHVAASFKIPMISLWGPGRPEHYADTDTRVDSFVFYSPDIYCSPCIYRTDFPPCRGNNVCMKSIPPKEVYKKACELLKINADADTSGMDRIFETQKNKKFDIIIKHPGY